MQRVDSAVDFTVVELSSKEFRVVCYPQADQDVKRIEDVFSKVGEGSYCPFSISLDEFTQKERIQFFDDILDLYSNHNEWYLEDVTDITIRKQSQQDNNYIIVDSNEGDLELVGENEEQPIGDDELLSISQAILQGKNLRTNSFVKKFEKQGYHFPAMTLLLRNHNTPEAIQVMIRFKLSPKMFEVVLTGMSEKHDYGEVVTSFPPERQQQILQEFWHTSHQVWRAIHDQAPRSQAIKQLSFAND